MAETAWSPTAAREEGLGNEPRLRVREKALKAEPHERGGVNNAARMRGEQAGKRESLGTTLEPEHSGRGKPVQRGPTHLDCAEGEWTPGEPIADPSGRRWRPAEKDPEGERNSTRGRPGQLKLTRRGASWNTRYARLRPKATRGSRNQYLGTVRAGNTLNERATPRGDTWPTVTPAR